MHDGGVQVKTYDKTRIAAERALEAKDWLEAEATFTKGLNVSRGHSALTVLTRICVPGHWRRRRGTCNGKSTVHPCNLQVRGANLSGGFDWLNCPRLADTALEPETLTRVSHCAPASAPNPTQMRRV